MEIVAQFGGAHYFPWKPTLLMPVGDIQFDGKHGAADLPRLHRFLEWGMEREAWFLGMGDFVDFLSPSNRNRLRMAGLYDTAEQVIDDAATDLENELMVVLAPTKGRWLGLLQGHHYYTHLTGGTSDTFFAKSLGCPFLGDCAILRLVFRDERGGSCALKVWAHHGPSRGASTPEGALAALKRHKIGHADCRLFLQGHLPFLGKTVSDSVDVPDRGPARLFHEDTHYVLTGGFARSYQQGSHFAGRAQGGYAEKAMMLPATLGAPVITLTPELIAVGSGKGRTSRRVVDIKESS